MTDLYVLYCFCEGEKSRSFRYEFIIFHMISTNLCLIQTWPIFFLYDGMNSVADYQFAKTGWFGVIYFKQLSKLSKLKLFMTAFYFLPSVDACKR
jgi:hypothetical protein